MSDFVAAISTEGEWLQFAACGPEDHPLFFATDEQSVARAKQVCSSCPVRIPCLTDALERGEEFGVWGGLTPDERFRQMARRAG